MSSLLGWVKKKKEETKPITTKDPVPAILHPAESWMKRFLKLKKNRYFCKIDKEFLEDTFSHYGVSRLVKGYRLVIKIILDKANSEDYWEASKADRRSLDHRAAQLYGLLHARFIVTQVGLHRMRRLFKKNYWGPCPRVGCTNQALLPIGINDKPNRDEVKLYCCSCGLMYRSNYHGSTKIDGAYFGTTFPHLFFMSFPDLLPRKKNLEFMTPQIYGFKLHKTWKASCRGKPDMQKRSCSF